MISGFIIGNIKPASFKNIIHRSNYFSHGPNVNAWPNYLRCKWLIKVVIGCNASDETSQRQHNHCFITDPLMRLIKGIPQR